MHRGENRGIIRPGFPPLYSISCSQDDTPRWQRFVALRGHPMLQERPLTIAQICDHVPGARGGERIAPSTVTRWIILGVPARDGNRVKLKATRFGSRWLVYQADLDAFLAALNNEPAEAPAPASRHAGASSTPSKALVQPRTSAGLSARSRAGSWPASNAIAGDPPAAAIPPEGMKWLPTRSLRSS